MYPGLEVEDDQGAFLEIESFDIAIPAGQTSGAATLRFTPVKDDVDEEDETVTLLGSELVAGGSQNSLPVRSASFTIIDDDTRGITLSPAKLAAGTGISMMEGGTSTYSLVLDSEPTDTVTVTVAGRQGDLISLTPETLTFTPSDWSTAQTISVVSLDDGTDTSFTNAVISHQVSGGDYGSVTVRDIWMLIKNTTQAYIYLDDAQASESDGYVEFTVTVRPILRTTPVLVRYATVDGTARAGSDYTRQVETGQTYKILNIPAGQSSATIRVLITDDQVYESAVETFTLQLTNHNNKATLDGDATSLTATGAIADDDPKPVVSVAGPAGEVSYVSENAKDPVTFTLTLVGQSAGDVTVDYATGEAGLPGLLTARQGLAVATEGEDYAGTSGTVTFTSGQTTRTVTVPVTNDDVSEETEFFGLRISAPQGADLRDQRSEDVADVGLLDDDPRGVTIHPTSIGLDEPASGETAVAGSYTVNLRSRPTDTVTVTIGGSDPAVSLSGNTLTNNQLTFTTTNWNTAQMVTVTPVKDDDAVGETITLTHTLSGGDYTAIAADSVTVNLTDSDTRNLVLSSQSLTVTEGDAAGARYTVELATQPSDTVTVTISGHDGADLTLSGTTLINNQLTFTTNNWGTAQTVTVQAGDDDNHDDESETLAHTAVGGDYINVSRDLPVTITDDDDPQVTVQFDHGAYTVAEGDPVTVTVSLDLAPKREVTVPITRTNQGASDSDYTGVPASVTFSPTETEQTFVFTAAHDDEDDDGERVRLSFGAMPDARVSAGTQATTTVSITDDDDPQVTVQFDHGAYTVAEGDMVTVTVTLSADPERTVEIPITATDQGGATSPADYTVPTSVTFNTNETSKTITFRATADALDDDGERVLLGFGTPLPTGVSPGPTDETTVSITDDDDPEVTVSFDQAAYTVAEGDMVTVTVTLSADPERTVEIELTATDQGGATSPADYTVPTSVTFNSGQTEQTFDFEAAHDDEDDDDETVVLGFGTALPPAVSLGTTTATTVTIDDDDDPEVTVSFDQAAYSVAEGDMVTVTVRLSADPERTVEIPITATGQDGATSPADYTVPTSVTFNTNETSKTITFRATADALDDDGERVLLGFGTPLPTGVSPGPTDETTVSITDDDDPEVTVSFDQAAYTVAEGDMVTVTVTLSADPERTVEIELTATGQDASPADYSGVPARVTFNAGDTEQTFDFEAAQDDEDDDDETVVLGFGTALPPAVSLGTTTATTVTIDDDDDPEVTVSFDQAAYTVAEGDMVTVTVTLSADPERTVEIELTATDQNASPADYSGVPARVTFNARDTEQTFDFEAAQDDEDDDDETVVLGFGTALPPAVSLGTTTATTVTIDDDDDPEVTVSFDQAAYTVAEGDMVTVTVTLSADPERTVEIELTATDQNGATPADYSIPRSVTFNSGQTEQTFDFEAAQDDEDDDDEKVRLSFGAMPDARVNAGTTAATTVSIGDDDVTAVNTPPTAAHGTVTTNEDTPYAFAATDFGYLDDDSDALASVKIIALPTAGTLILDGTAIASGALPKTVAAAHLTASKLKYSPPANANGTGFASFTFKVNDGRADSPEYIMTINVTPVNDPATGAPTISGTAHVGETLTASIDGIEDLDGVPSSLNYQWKRYAANGTTLEANIGADASTYTLTESEEGKKVKVEVSFTDNGGTSEGPLVSAAYPASLSQTVGAAPVVNTPPTASDGPVTTNEDTPYAFAATDFGYLDDDSDALASVKIIALPTAGTLILDGTAIASGALPKTVATADLTASKLKYSPPANANGTGFASFTFKVNDGRADSPEYIMTINVTPVNDPATGAPTISGTAHVGETLTASIDGIDAIADADGLPSSFTYQWIRVGADGTSNPTDISGNSNTYLLTEADFGKRIKVRVDFTDGQGGAESRTSDAYPRDGTVQRMTVQFEQAAYTVAEGGTVTVTVTLSVDPEHMMVIPIAKENMGGAGSTDYSGVPHNVTFNAGDTSKSFDFDAAQDDEDDDGESVRVVFGSSLPPGVSLGALAETVVSIGSRTAQQLGGNVGQTGTVVTITRVPYEDSSTFVEGTEALFRLNFEAVGGGPSPGGVDVHLRYSWHIPSPLVTAHGYASQGTWSVPRVDVWDSAVPIHDNDFGNPDGTLTIRIIGCERSDCMIGTPSVLTLTITDDDGGPATAVPGPPGVPRLVCARSGDGYDDTGIAVSWKAPNFVGGAPVESYELRYRESSQFVGGRLIEHRWKSWPHGVAATSATLTGLVPRASYTVQVRAVNGNGPGLWSEPWRFRVGPTDEVCEIIDQLAPP